MPRPRNRTRPGTRIRPASSDAPRAPASKAPPARIACPSVTPAGYGSEEAHAGRDVDLDQPRAVRRDGVGEFRPELLEVAHPLRRHAVAGGDRGGVERREVEPRRARDLLEVE